MSGGSRRGDRHLFRAQFGRLDWETEESFELKQAMPAKQRRTVFELQRAVGAEIVGMQDGDCYMKWRHLRRNDWYRVRVQPDGVRKYVT